MAAFTSLSFVTTERQGIKGLDNLIKTCVSVSLCWSKMHKNIPCEVCSKYSIQTGQTSHTAQWHHPL